MVSEADFRIVFRLRRGWCRRTFGRHSGPWLCHRCGSSGSRRLLCLPIGVPLPRRRRIILARRCNPLRRLAHRVNAGVGLARQIFLVRNHQRTIRADELLQVNALARCDRTAAPFAEKIRQLRLRMQRGREVFRHRAALAISSGGKVTSRVASSVL